MRSFVAYKMTDTLARPPSSSRRIAWSFGRFSDIRYPLVLTFVMRDKIQLDSSHDDANLVRARGLDSASHEN